MGGVAAEGVEDDGSRRKRRRGENRVDEVEVVVPAEAKRV